MNTRKHLQHGILKFQSFSLVEYYNPNNPYNPRIRHHINVKLKNLKSIDSFYSLEHGEIPAHGRTDKGGNVNLTLLSHTERISLG